MAHAQRLDDVIGLFRGGRLRLIADDDNQRATPRRRQRPTQQPGHVRARRKQRNILRNAAHDRLSVPIARTSGHKADPARIPSNQTDLVPSSHREPRDRLARRERDLLLCLPRRRQRPHLPARIDNQDDLHVRGRLVPLDRGGARASGRRPIDLAHVVTGLVGRQVHELPAAAPPQRRVLSLHDGQQLAQDGQLDARRQCVDLTRPHWHAGSPGDRRSTSAPVTAPEPR